MKGKGDKGMVEGGRGKEEGMWWWIKWYCAGRGLWWYEVIELLIVVEPLVLLCDVDIDWMSL